MSERVILRPAVRRFAEAMERKLRANDHKGGWGGCEPLSLVRHLRQEVNELEQEVRRGPDRNRTSVRDEGADVGNMAMMVVDVLGGLADGDLIVGDRAANLHAPTIIVPGFGLVPLFAPEPRHIDPQRMARALAREGRYANQSAVDYFVAEHCWLVSMLCPEAPLQGLVHDGPEAWLGDLIGPLKKFLRLIEGCDVSSFDLVEEAWWRAVADRFGVAREMHPRVEFVDKALRVVEQRLLYPGCEHLIRGSAVIGSDWLAEQSEIAGLREPLAIRCLPSGEAYELFMERLAELWTEPAR